VTTATAGIAAQPERRASLRFGSTVRLWLLVSAITAGALALYVLEVRGFSAPVGSLRLPWWGLAVFFYLAEAFVIHLHFRREAHTLSLNECGLVLGLFFASPGQLIVGQLVGALAALVLHRRQRPIKVAFNLAQFGLTTCVAIVIFRSLAEPAGRAGPNEWVAALLAATAACGLGVLLVAVAIRLAQGATTLRSLARVSAISLVGTAVNASLALAAVKLVETDWSAALLLALPLAACVAIYRVYNIHRRRYEHLEFLYDSMRSIQEAPQFAAAVRQVLVSACELVHAEFAEVLLVAGDRGERVLRSTLGRDHEALMQSSTLTPLEQIALDMLDRSQDAALLGRRHDRTELDGYLVERGLQDAIVTALRGEDRVFGLMLIGDRAGDVETFSDHDRKLCETFAAHAAVLLENDRLEQSIAELTALKEQLHHQAYHDSLTGLPNRALFTDRVAQALSASGGRRPVVLFLDLDDFKTVNDSLGHAFGDELLRIVAKRVQACVRLDDTPARMGGDEFAVLLTGGRTPDADLLAHRLAEAVREPMLLGGRQISLHASIGIARAEGSTQTADDLLQNADVAMYSAKASGKHGYVLYEPRMHQLVRRRHELSTALERAVEKEQIAVHYQPIIDFRAGRAVTVEALARWRHPERGVVSPGEFVPLAVETGLMIPIGQVVLREACRQTAEWRQERGLDALSVTVNLAASELQNPRLVDEVAAVLAETGLPPSCLALEITESSAMLEPDVTIERMRALRGLGVRLALDDFGTGYSSLSHLSQFPIDIVKIAKDFIDRLEEDASGITFVDTMIRLAESLGLETVAEGIEHRSQAETLEQLKCRYGQGFHFAAPLEASEVPRYLRTGLRLVA
jgi:diguanylate cyclase (GGDEF)-like protein